MVNETMLEQLKDKGPVFVYGGPTTGKSTFIASSTLPILDTDWLVEGFVQAVVPGIDTWEAAWDFWKQDEASKPTREQFEKFAKALFSSIEEKKAHIIIMSNMHGLRTKWDYAYAREPELILEMMRERGLAKGRPVDDDYAKQILNWHVPKIPGLEILAEGEFIGARETTERSTKADLARALTEPTKDEITQALDIEGKDKE